MPETCHFCNKTFSNKNSLISHQKKTKYCLIIQGKLSEIKNKCSYCDEMFSNDYIKKHKETCSKKSEYYENRTKQLEDHIVTLGKELAYLEGKIDVLEKSKNIHIENATISNRIDTKTNYHNNSSVINFLAPLDELKKEDVERIASENFIPNYLHQGQLGIAKFCKDHIVSSEDGRKRITCTDPTRLRFKIKNADNTVREDPEAREFITRVAEPIKTATKDVYEDVKTTYDNEQKEIEKGERKDGVSKEDIEYKKNRLIRMYFDILNFDNSELNKNFLKEFSKITKV